MCIMTFYDAQFIFSAIKWDNFKWTIDIPRQKLLKFVWLHRGGLLNYGVKGKWRNRSLNCKVNTNLVNWSVKVHTW